MISSSDLSDVRERRTTAPSHYRFSGRLRQSALSNGSFIFLRVFFFFFFYTLFYGHNGSIRISEIIVSLKCVTFIFHRAELILYSCFSKFSACLKVPDNSSSIIHFEQIVKKNV